MTTTSNALRFAPITSDIYSAEKVVTYTCAHNNKQRATRCIFRLDGRSGSYRVDRLGVFGWEAIDNGEGRPLGAAKQLVRSYIREVRLQGTLTPTL